MRKMCADGATLAMLAEAFGRDASKCFSKANKLGLSVARGPRPDYVRVAVGFWTEGVVAELTRLHGLGHSGSQIAKALGCTRNMVTAKRHRLGLKHDAPSAAAPRKQASAPTGHPWRAPTTASPKAAPPVKRAHASCEPPAPKALPIFAPEPVPATARTLANLGSSMCRWPINDPGVGHMDQTLFCAARCDGPYCSTHQAKAWTKPPAKAPQTANELARSLRRYL